ncbi:hypothetical protein ANCDUO_25203 [Ancylostoma duodenale]|uniref:Uncharacterized protein n=1 Tax=Ancylostoma duodenale TaxID=51022 RepID=A0A0C2FDH6_9BILA|nr:hypothetical protein ANCDUO_25203 [Ancylostoma duodenale]
MSVKSSFKTSAKFGEIAQEIPKSWGRWCPLPFSQVWDCDLEYYAQTQNCNGKIDDLKYMSNVEEFSTGKTCDLGSQTRSILTSWWDEVRKVDLAASQEYVAGLEHFAPMAAAEAIGFACTYDACSSSKSKLLCIYDKVLVLNDKIYDEGNSAADICATCAAQQKCTAWLCQEDYQPGEAN